MSFFRILACGVALASGAVMCAGAQTVPRQKAPPKTHTVTIVQMKFQPADLQVKKGDQVVFVNKDMVPHDVTETAGKKHLSPLIAAGESWTMVATKSLSYQCSFHPVMKGKITVH